jgi:hypothetical protein
MRPFSTRQRSTDVKSNFGEFVFEITDTLPSLSNSLLRSHSIKDLSLIPLAQKWLKNCATFGALKTKIPGLSLRFLSAIFRNDACLGLHPNKY